MFITPSWRPIVVKTIRQLFVLDWNGSPVAKTANSCDISLISTFHVRYGFDFVAFQDTDSNTLSFDPANPSLMIPVESGGTKLICIDYSWQTDHFFFIAGTGKVLAVPEPLPNWDGPFQRNLNY
jgi:hypothetical protein